MKVVINKCYGGFSPSSELYEMLIAKGWRTTTFDSCGFVADVTARIVVHEGSLSGFAPYSFVGGSDDLSLRTDPELVSAVETLGDAASGLCGNLCVVEIPDDVTFDIEDYDGFEHVAEVRRTWG